MTVAKKYSNDIFKRVGKEDCSRCNCNRIREIRSDGTLWKGYKLIYKGNGKAKLNHVHEWGYEDALHVKVRFVAAKKGELQVRAVSTMQNRTGYRTRSDRYEEKWQTVKVAETVEVVNLLVIHRF